MKPKDLRAFELRWILGTFLALSAILSVFTIDIGAESIAVAGTLLIFGILIHPPALRKIPRAAYRILPFLLVVIVVSDFVQSGGDVLPPLTRMILLLTLYRVIQYRTGREDLQLVILTLFMIVLSGVLSQEIWFLLQIFVYAPLAMGVLFAVCLGERIAQKEAPTLAFSSFRWVGFISYWKTRFDQRLVLITGGLFLATALSASFLFLLLPRFEIGQALPFLRLNTAQSLSGFTNEIRYGDITSILEDDSVALRVDVTSGNPPAQPYWRMLVLDAYHADGFNVSEDVHGGARHLENFFFPAQRENPEIPGADWTFYLEGGVSRYLPLPGDFQTLRFNNRQELRFHAETNVVALKEVQANTLFYRLENLLPGDVMPISTADKNLAGLEATAANLDDPNSFREHQYPATTLIYPDGTDNLRILRMAFDEIGDPESLGRRRFMEEATRWLQEGRGYSLESQIVDGEAHRLLRWVEGNGPGHCELYAGALVLIGRYAGIPTRLVTGFLGGDWNGFENYYMIRNRNAHAWVEYFNPEEGWVRIDPTPGNEVTDQTINVEEGQGNIQIDRTFRAYIDSLRVLWYRRVVNFDQQDQAVAIEWFREQGKGFWDNWKDQWKQWEEAWKNEGFSGLRKSLPSISPWIPLGLSILGLLWLFRKRSFGGRRRPSEIARIRRQASRALRNLEKKAPKGMSPQQVQLRKEILTTTRYGHPDDWSDPPVPKS